MSKAEQSTHIMATQLILNNQVLTLLDTMTPDKSIDELNAIRSEIDRKQALVAQLENELKAIA